MAKITRNPLEDIVGELSIMNMHLQEHNALLREQVDLNKSNDWKLWILSNAVVDGLLKAKLIDSDPRNPQVTEESDTDSED